MDGPLVFRAGRRRNVRIFRDQEFDPGTAVALTLFLLYNQRFFGDVRGMVMEGHVFSFPSPRASRSAAAERREGIWIVAGGAAKGARCAVHTRHDQFARHSRRAASAGCRQGSANAADIFVIVNGPSCDR